jgi:hypothetical protein
MTRADMAAVVAQAVEDNRWVVREGRTQAALDRLIETAHADGQVVMGFALLLLQAARCAGEDVAAAAVSAISGVLADFEGKRPGRGEPAGPSATVEGTPHANDAAGIFDESRPTA